MHFDRRKARPLRKADAARKTRIALEEVISAARIFDKLKVYAADQIKFRREFPADCLEFAVAEHLYREAGPALTSEILFSCERHGVARPVSHRIHTDHAARDKGLREIAFRPAEHAQLK